MAFGIVFDVIIGILHSLEKCFFSAFITEKIFNPYFRRFTKSGNPVLEAVEHMN